MQKIIYNTLKLSEYHSLFHSIPVLVIGAGAVGTHLVEKLAKLGVSPDTIDYDHFTLENAAKHGCLIRTPEDAGRNKALCAAERVQPLLDEGCTANGIDGELCRLGPEAFAAYRYVVAAVDNYDAKLYLGEMIRQLPPERRPVVIMDGTIGESASSVMLDNTDFCIDCLIGEGWKKERAVHTSCTGPQFRTTGGVREIVRTSNLASSLAAHLTCEQLRAHVIGFEGVMNRRLTYTAFPGLELSSSHPMRKVNCPGCAVHPPAKIEWLRGSVLDTTLGDVMAQIGAFLGSDDFELSVHRFSYSGVVHGGFVAEDVCCCCGRPIRVMQHEGRLFADDLRCADCAAADKPVQSDTVLQHVEPLHAFTPASGKALRALTLYEAGYPLGAHLEVIQRNGALDFLDVGITRTVFAFECDAAKMHTIHKL